MQIQVRTLCPEWVSLKSKDPAATPQIHRQKSPNCECGVAEGQSWKYGWRDISEVLAIAEAPVVTTLNDSVDDLTGLRDQQDPVDDMVGAPSAPEVKKRRGRQPGSKNKPKESIVEPLVDDTLLVDDLLDADASGAEDLL